uniref:Uncharacterized protein n=1 Tax=Physcomitrium patens TaxID=3218 RepID=A0A2K1J383_PHYPA|nr:hypothetical protein PHYPA_021831 [Physcomitrium patens]
MTLREYCSLASVSNVCTQGQFTMTDLKRVALVCDGCFSRFTFITMLTKTSVIHGFVCADLGTEHDRLVQEVVVPDVPSGLRSYPSCSTKERMYNPLKVEHWDVKEEIEEFFKRADKRKHAYEISVTSSTRKTSVTAKMEGIIVANIMSEIQHFMKKKQPQLKFRFESQVVLSSIEKKKDETYETNKTDKTDKTGSDAKFSPNLVDLVIRNPRADFVVTIHE